MSDQEKITLTPEQMNEAAEDLLKRFAGMGFVLLVFPFEANGGLNNYVSNARMDDVPKILNGAAFSLQKTLLQAEPKPKPKPINGQ